MKEVEHRQPCEQPFKIIDLFAGIGGFSLAGHWRGWETAAFVEKDPYCQKVLAKNFKNVTIYEDVFNFKGTKYRGRANVVCGGFPCQPFSSAGKRQGQNDERYLWPEMLRIIDEVEPDYAVAENVHGLINIDRGYTLDCICADLENIGYEKPIIFDTKSDFTGIPTMERHIWIISTPTRQRRQRGKKKQNQDNGKKRQFPGANKRKYRRWDISETRFRGVGERLSRRMDRHQRERLKALGNAIVPQVAYEVFAAIEQHYIETRGCACI